MSEVNLDQSLDRPSNDATLTVSRAGVHYLNETSKWGYFLSIMGFILSGIIALLGIFAGSFISAMTRGQSTNFPQGMSSLFGIIYFLIGLLYFFPSWYLFKYSRKLKSAIVMKNSDELAEAFENQKSLYKFWGILTIVILSIYAVIFLFALVIASFK